MTRDPKPKPTPVPTATASESDVIWIDGAPFATEGAIFAFAPQLLTPDLLRDAPDEATHEKASSVSDD